MFCELYWMFVFCGFTENIFISILFAYFLIPTRNFLINFFYYLNLAIEFNSNEIIVCFSTSIKNREEYLKTLLLFEIRQEFPLSNEWMYFVAHVSFHECVYQLQYNDPHVKHTIQTKIIATEQHVYNHTTELALNATRRAMLLIHSCILYSFRQTANMNHHLQTSKEMIICYSDI